MLKSRLIVSCFIVLLVSAAALSAEAVRGLAPAVVLDKGPALDGTMADPAWQKGAELLFGSSEQSKVDPAAGTGGRVLFDQDNLYIGVKCQASDVQATVSDRDGPVWKDDCVEIFVSSDLTGGYWHVAVNALGTVTDEWCGPFGKHADRNLGVQAKAAMQKGTGWTVTLAIPLSDLGAVAGKDLPWRLSITRTQQAHGGEKYRECSWANLGTDQFHTPAQFGRIEGLSLPVRPGRPAAPAAANTAPRGQAKAVMVTKGPAIDGTMSDPVWSKGALLVLGPAKSAEEDPLARSTARVLLDARNLYVGIRCGEDLTDTLQTKRTGRDQPVWDDDCVEIYVAPDAWVEHYQFIVNPRGAVFDQRVTGKERDAAYNADVQVKAATAPGKAWTVTLAIPLKDLNAFVGKDQSWRLNVTRYRQKRQGEQATQEFSWGEIGPGGFHDPFHFGTLAGVDIPKTPDGVTREVDPEVIHFTPEAEKDGEVLLKAVADIWLSGVGEEQLNSMGKAKHFKLKTCQEVAVIRFDASPAAGREVKSATLYVRRDGGDQLRRFRTYTCAQSWKEGNTTEDYGAPSGACFSYADYEAKKAWAWDNSWFWDVSFGDGHTIGRWTESVKHRNGWISIPLMPELIYAMAAGSTDGIALQEGGTLSYYNNFLFSAQAAGSEPRIVVELGGPLPTDVAKPKITVEPVPAEAHLTTGAIRVTVAEAPNVFSYNVRMNGKPVDRWRIAYPAEKGPTELLFDEVPPAEKLTVEVEAVTPGGKVSPRASATVTSSPALPLEPKLRKFIPPSGGAVPEAVAGQMLVWPVPANVKISPLTGKPIEPDIGADNDYRAANAVWDGKTVNICGARGEYVSFQLCVERLGGALTGVKVMPGNLTGPGGAVIGGTEIELYKNWYARPPKQDWQPHYALPMKHGEAFDVPDPARKLPGQKNQTVTVDVYVPKDAKAGKYTGRVVVLAESLQRGITLPVELTVWDFQLPDKLSFWPELNAYNVPGRREGTTLDYHRLAHRHRCVLNTWTYRPKISGSGKAVTVHWEDYDREVGPLLSGEAFKDSRRAGVPTPVLYLPYGDDWPGGLSPKTYSYDGPWPGRDGNYADLITHFLTAPYIGDGLTDEYKAAFLSVQKQFVEHFREKGWNRTEMQCFYGGKMWFRVQYGSSCWWTTDEPYHLDDWLALQFFGRLWTDGIKALGADGKQWVARGDISRPWNQGRMMDGAEQVNYYGSGGFMDEIKRRRCRIICRRGGIELRNYGSGGARGLSAMLLLWVNGSNAMLPWQTLGPDKSLDVGDIPGGGASLLVPGQRFGLPVIGDLRLKAFRESEQIIEYMAILKARYGLTREQIGGLIGQQMKIEYSRATDARVDDADASTGSVVKAWELVELRRALAELITKK